MLKDCQAGGRFKGIVLITEWKESPFRAKPGSFIAMTCQDSSASLSAKIWETEACHFDWLKDIDVFQVEASVSEFRGAIELSIESLQPVPADEIDLTKLLPASPIPAEILEQRLENLRNRILNENLKNLLSHLLDHSKIGVLYRQAPAAMKVHQPYLRGLWEHSLGVAELAINSSANYPEANCDLVIIGALLHDIGKIYEYNYERGISYTTDGRLLGHIIMGVDLLSREIAGIPDFPMEMRTKLLHIITSHHGRYEWQSPRRPKCIEAVIIHYADAMEADLWQFRQALQENSQEEWSPYVKSMERYLYLG